VHEIYNPTSGLVDAVTSLSATSPTLPTGYTRFCRIGSMKTDISAHWIAFIQDNDLFQWAAPVADIAVTNPGASAVTRTLASVPTGVNVQANLQLWVSNTGVGGNAVTYLSDLATNDIAPVASGSVFGDSAIAIFSAGGLFAGGSRVSVRTNTAAQIRSRLSFSDASVGLNINTLGWTDPRGKNS
jgi:hypothetical protein